MTWTPVMVHREICALCGLEISRHGVVDQRCQHTADSLTDQQITQLWRRIQLGRIGNTSITFTDVLDASQTQNLPNLAAFYYPAPSPIERQRAREKIALILNTMEPT